MSIKFIFAATPSDTHVSVGTHILLAKIKTLSKDIVQREKNVLLHIRCLSSSNMEMLWF